jgi:predicted  nucleic acid-binding Zn-ribbon protein
MVKTEAEVRAKMQERVQTAGKYLQAGMDAAEDPIDKLLQNPDEYEKKLIAGVQEAQKRGSYKAGLQKAKERNAWQNSKARAAQHFEERADDMVDNAMSSYNARAQAIAKAQAAVKDMPTTTRQQRIAKSAKYQEVVGAEFDKVFGRK